MNRPAEVAGGAGALALLVARIAGVADPDVLVSLGVAIGLVPGLVTLLVANGGIRGAFRRLWAGKAE